MVNLSGGNQQKVVIAKWLVSDAEIIGIGSKKEAKSLRTLDAGTKVEVLIRGEGWTIVKYKNQTGYVMSWYLQFP